MQTLKLYQYWRSSCSWRVRWALLYKKIPFETITVNLKDGDQLSQDFLKINPSGFVPVLFDGTNYLSDSISILEWLEESYPQQALLPNDVTSRYQVRRMMFTIACGVQPIQNLNVQKYVARYQDKLEFARHFIVRGFQAYEKILASNALQYSFAGKLSFADLCLIPQVYNALRFNVDMAQFPKILSIYNFNLSLEECNKAHPDQFNNLNIK